MDWTVGQLMDNWRDVPLWAVIGSCLIVLILVVGFRSSSK